MNTYKDISSKRLSVYIKYCGDDEYIAAYYIGSWIKINTLFANVLYKIITYSYVCMYL